MVRLICGCAAIVCLVGCGRPAAIQAPPQSIAKHSPVEKIESAKPRPAGLMKIQVPAHKDVPTPFLSTDQLQTIELMRLNSVPESGFPDELTIVEETEDERTQRERREAWDASYAPREYSQDEEDVMEALLRHCLQKDFAAGVPGTKALSILGRTPSERFLKRFAGEAVAFEFGHYDTRGVAYEIYKWQMAPPDRAGCWLCGRDSGGMHILSPTCWVVKTVCGE